MFDGPDLKLYQVNGTNVEKIFESVEFTDRKQKLKYCLLEKQNGEIDTVLIWHQIPGECTIKMFNVDEKRPIFRLKVNMEVDSAETLEILTARQNNSDSDMYHIDVLSANKRSKSLDMFKKVQK